MKKTGLFLTMTGMVLSVMVTPFSVLADVQTEELPTGLLPVEEIAIKADDSELYESSDELLSETALYYAQIYDSSWDVYKNYYVYNQLSDAEKSYWDALDAVCMKYLTTETDANTDGTYNYLDMVTSEELGNDEMRNIVEMFRHSNPQYYFLNYTVFRMEQNGKTYYAYGVYSAFAGGSARKTATEAVKAQVTDWENMVAACGSTAEKVQKIHDLIAEKVSYNEAIYDEKNFDEDTQYSQSCYSVFCTDQTVCAGYALAFEMLCNGAGVDAMAVTSTSHEWNKVRIEDSWYNVDVTWDDDTSSYAYFERNDTYYDTESAYSASNHREEAFWEDYLPLCTLDAEQGTDVSVPGVLPTITAVTDTPVITVNKTAQTTEITCGTSGAVIYYTTDGTTPSPAATKSVKYTGTVSGALENVQAVAVCNARRDSSVATAQAETEVLNGLYKIGDYYYYYENGVMATSKEAYVNGAWRWFDADGTMAVSKDVYQLSYAGEYADREDGTGKWVRYDADGEMVKGWQTTAAGVYYFDLTTGAMAKGNTTVDGVPCAFSWSTGIGLDCQWNEENGVTYWYEGGRRQGLDGRGKEIYDPASDAWYWLDAVDSGKKATSKDVYQESWAGAYADRADGTGKWVRYDANGHMIKGWQRTDAGTYYFDLITGAMAKGNAEIDGQNYYFDETTGILQ